MPIDVRCTHCGKGYVVDIKMLGKQTTCKACNKPFTIALIEDDGYSFREAPAPASTDPNKPAARPKPVNDTFCPSCGTPMTSTAKVCLSCGYNKETGERRRTHVDASAKRAPAPVTTGGEHRGYGGIRTNTPYANPLLAVLDVYVPTILWWLYWALFGFGVIRTLITIAQAISTHGSNVDPTAVLMVFVAPFLTVATFFWMLFAGIWGVGIAGKIMKYEMPDELFKRSMAITFCTACIGVTAIVVPIVTATASGGGVAALQRAALGSVFLAIVVTIPVNFLATWLWFRLTFLETLVAFPIKVIFEFLGGLALVLLVYAIGQSMS